MQYYVFDNEKLDANSKDKTMCVSEGQGYGMMIMVFMAGYEKMAQTYFDGMFKFYRSHPTKHSPYLMCWNVSRGCRVNEAEGNNTAARMMHFFYDEKVAAVAGNVRVGNTINLLTNWQLIEYTTSQNFDRRAYDRTNSIIVVPGAIGAFRKSAVLEVGAFAVDTLAEDCDLTLRLLRAGYRVRNCNEAISLTEAPETLKMFLKQRFRWTFGIMQSFWKHRDLLFTGRLKNLGWILLPNILVFQLILPLISPIVDILFVISMFSNHSMPVVVAYFIYFAIDVGISIMSFRFDNQRFTPRLMVHLFIQRILYRQLFFYIIIKSYLKAIKGELMSWGFLKRTGNVQ